MIARIAAALDMERRMSKSKMLIVLLIVTLIGTNAWAVFRIFDLGMSLTYRDASYHHCNQALEQALAAIRAVAKPKAGQDEVLAAVKLAAKDEFSFEKNGFVWVGYLGMKFDEAGKLIDAVSNEQ